MTVCEETLRNFKFHLPGRQVTKLTINKEAINSPQKYLSKLIDQSDKLFHEELEKFANLKRTFKRPCYEN